MNPISVDYRIACVGGIVIGAVLAVIAITTSHAKFHLGLLAWSIWLVLSAILLLILRATDSTLQASDAEDGQTVGFALAHLGQGPILIIIATAAIAGVITAVYGI